MGKLIMKSAPLSGDPEVKVPSFNFCRYEAGEYYHNDETRIDFVTDEKSLYVCLVSHTATEPNVANEQGFLKLVSEGPQGIQGAKGDDGADAVTPIMSAEFIGDQLKLIINNKIAALSPSLTGPSWKPVLENNVITWELTNDRYAPDSIDLETLRPIQKSPLLLRTNSDNTKRSDETSGPANFIQWKYEGDEYWTNLISISELMNLTLAGVSIWKDETDEKWHFGHREVIKASYDSDKNGHKIISDVRLGDILFDAGELPFAESEDETDYGVDITAIWAEIAGIKAAMVKSVNNVGPDPVTGNVDVDCGSGFDPTGYATESWVANNYQPKGAYVTAVKANGVTHQPVGGVVDLGNIGGGSGTPVDTSDCVKSVTINGTTKTPVNGNVSFTISAGETSLFDVRFDTSSHKLQKTVDGQTWTDLVDLDDYTGGTGGGMTESEVKHLIGQVLEGVLDSAIPEYVKGSDHNYFIRLSDLANYTTVDDVAAMIRDAMTGQNVDYYRVFTLYQRTNSPTTAPAKPVVGVWEWNTAANVDAIALKPNNSSAWSNHPENATTSTPYLWMTSATYSYLTKSEVGQDPWETPICLTAEPGEDGADGDSVEFIYILCTDAEFNNIKNTTPVAEHGDNRPDDLPVYTTPSGNGWTDHPSGISETYQIEAVSIRTKDNGTWSSYSNPTIWSMWGEDGIDGDGVEYIFAVAAESETAVDPQTGKRELNASFFRGQNALDILPLSDADIAAYEQAGGNYQISDWCPNGEIINGVQMCDLNWTDNPSDVGPDQPYEFVAIRKKKLDPVSGQMKWGPFSTPALWGFWGQKTVTVIESGNVYRHPYTCFAFTRSATDITGYTVVNPWTYNNITYAAWIAADNTREEGYYSNPLSYVVTLDDNNQIVSSANLTWSDTIPAPPGQLYMITNHIGDEGSGNDQGWTSPRAWGDASGFQVEYANSSTATDNVYNRVTGYTLPRLDNYDIDNHPNLNDQDNDGIDEDAWRTAVQTAGMGVWGDENDITDPDYMATCYKKQEGVWSNWQISRIKGERGDDSDIPGPAGKDGTDIEFVYFRTDAENHRPGMSPTYGTYNGQTKVSEDLYEDDFLPMATANGFTLADNELKIGNDFFWHDHPAGVTENLSCEWVGMRHSSYDLQGDKVWGNFNIALWSKYGANGRDGDGIEYVFWGLTEAQANSISGAVYPTQQSTNSGANSKNRVDSRSRHITDPEYLPAIVLPTDNDPIEAVDDNPGISETYPYVYASMRKYNGGSRSWGEFGPIKLWLIDNSVIASTNVTLDLNNSEQPVQVTDQDKVVKGTDWISINTNMFSVLRTDHGVLLDWGELYIGKFANGEVVFGSTPDVTFNNYVATIAGTESTDGTIKRKIAEASGDENRYYEIRLAVQFPSNHTLSEPYVVPIKVVDATGVFYGIDYIRFNPIHSDKLVTLNFLSQTNVIKKASEDATTYNPSTVDILPSTSPADSSFDTVANFRYSYAIDNGNEVVFAMPSINKQTVLTNKGAYYYFNSNGTVAANSSGAFATLHIWNVDDHQREWDDWLASMTINLNGTAITDKIVLGAGYGNEITDRETSYVIYPGKNGEKGDNGTYKKELYRRGTENAAEGTWNNTWSSTGTTIATLTTAGWSAAKPQTNSSYPHIWMTRADVTIGQEATQVCVWETPTRITPVDGNVTHTYEHTYEYLAGTIMRTSEWSSGTTGTTKYWNGNTRVVTTNSVETQSLTDEGIKYLDVVSVTTTTNGVTKTSWYKCITNHTKTSTSPATDSTNWAEFAIMGDAAFHNLLVENAAYIESLTSKQVVITDNNTIVAGMASGTDIASASGNQTVGNVRIWAGTPTTNGDLRTAPFTVDDAGKLVSDDAKITGEIHAESGTIDGVLTIGSEGGITTTAVTAGSNGNGGTSTWTQKSTFCPDEVRNDLGVNSVFDLENYSELSMGLVQVHQELGSTGNNFVNHAILAANALQFEERHNGHTYYAVTAPSIKANASVMHVASHIEVVDALPSSPDSSTIYFVL